MKWQEIKDDKIDTMTEKKVLCLEAEKASEGDYQPVILRRGRCDGQCKALGRRGRPTEIVVRTVGGEKFVRECRQNLSGPILEE